jgi:DNA processing protein
LVDMTAHVVDERAALIALAHCVEPGDASIGTHVQRYGALAVLDGIGIQGSGIRQAEGLTARLTSSRWERAEDDAMRLGARLVTRVDLEWPTQLDDLGPAAPFALWVVGAANLRLIALRSVAMVGARACTGYGEDVARTWAAELAGEQWSIVSGGAFGIDAAAHRGALAAEGVTVCILAGGVDVPYPRAHDALIARIADEGLVVSETPLGESVRRQRFLSRNRVIAGLSRATVVVEAAVRSGTIATARAAAQMSRPVLAVPGPVTSAASAGCHRMIGDGEAVLVSSAREVMSLLDLGFCTPEGPSDREAALSPEERRVLDALPARGARSVAVLVQGSGLSTATVVACLGALDAQGFVASGLDGWRLVSR